MDGITPDYIRCGRSTMADAIARQRNVRILRAGALIALAAWSMIATVKLIRARHELAIARGEVLGR